MPLTVTLESNQVVATLESNQVVATLESNQVVATLELTQKIVSYIGPVNLRADIMVMSSASPEAIVTRTITATKQADIFTGDVQRFSFPITLDDSPIVDSATDVQVRLLALIPTGGAFEYRPVADARVATFDTVSQRWVVDFTADDTNGFLATPSDSTSSLLSNEAVLEIQVGAQGMIGSIISPKLFVSRGSID